MAIHALNKVAYKTEIPTPIWNVRQSVWLEGKNLPLPYGTVKLAPRWHGPFKITKIISPVAVQLKLPAQWSIHPVFHTSLITPYTETPSHGPNFTRPPPDLIDGEEEYEVEQIRAHRRWGCSKTLQYLIKWKGYPESDNTWENADQTHAPTLIKLYHQTNTLDSLKARRLRLEQHQSLALSPPKTFSCSTSSQPTILRDTTATLVWSKAHEDNTRLTCNLSLAPQVQFLSIPTPHTTPPESCATLMEHTSILQTSTASNNNSLYALHHLAPRRTHQCLPSLRTMPQMNHQAKPPSNYLPDLAQLQHQSLFHLAPSRQPYKHNKIWMQSSSAVLPTASSKPLLIERPTPLYP
jgi:Chromo (CHRromatin Organisation MOdifier) domain